MLETAALVVSTLIFTLSAVRKARDLISPTGHALMGSGKLYPGWLLPLALVHEIAMLLLLHLERPLGIVLTFAFIGGIIHAQASPGGPYEKAGRKALIPLAIVVGSAIALSLTYSPASVAAGSFSQRYYLDKIGPAGMLETGAAAVIGGFAFGAWASSLDPLGEARFEARKKD